MVKVLKKVEFRMEELPVIQYNRNEVRSFLRDKFAQYLVKHSFEKLALGEFANVNEVASYITKVFNEALRSKLPPKELRQVEYMHTKFPFLQYHKTQIDMLIHMTTYKFVALCSGDKKEVKSMVCNSQVTDENGKALNFREELDWEHSRALCNDVAELTRECLREFLYEFQTTGKIMLSAELAEPGKIIAAEDADEYLDDFEPEDADASSEERPSEDPQKVRIHNNAISYVYDDEAADKSSIIRATTEANSKPYSLLYHLLSWIYELPEYLQDRFFNSAPIIALIESAKQLDAIYDKKVIEQDFAGNTPSPVITNDSTFITEDKIHEKIAIANCISAESVDMSMVLKDPIVTVWILPTIGSGVLFDDAGFNGLVNFNGLDGLNVF